MCVNRKLTRVILVAYAQSADCKCNPFTPPPPALNAAETPARRQPDIAISTVVM